MKRGKATRIARRVQRNAHYRAQLCEIKGEHSSLPEKILSKILFRQLSNRFGVELLFFSIFLPRSYFKNMDASGRRLQRASDK